MWIDDHIIAKAAQPLYWTAWIPRQTVVVVGNGNDAAKECSVANCEQDGVNILRRYGGGGTVVLHSGCVCISLGLWVKELYANGVYFRALNDAVIRCLSQMGTELNGLGQRGISDIAVGDLKIGGTSMFRSRNYLLYQASLLVDPGLALIARYLAHPSREPDYRQGRAHDQFLTGLSCLKPGLNSESVKAHIDATFAVSLLELADHRIAPIPEQIPSVLARPHRS